MTIAAFHAPATRTTRPAAIALHCSGGTGRHWRHLAQELGPSFDLIAPDLIGCIGAPSWSGTHPSRLVDEARKIVTIIDGLLGPVHLVGHSYGGGVAMRVALERPNRIATMALYEPSAFHLLRQSGDAGAKGYAEIADVARRVCRGIISGNYRGSVAGFVDYWNGPGAWAVMPGAIQNALTRWAPKAALDFVALMNEPAPARAYRLLDFPVLILRGAQAPLPTRVIAEQLPKLLPNCLTAVIAGAGHMGPITHAREVSSMIVRHIAAMTSPEALVA